MHIVYCNQSFRSFNNFLVFSLNNPEPILSTSFYESVLNTVFYIFGFGGKAEGKSIQAIVNAFLGMANICLLNWEREASPGILGPISYPVTAIPNTIRVCTFEYYLTASEYAPSLFY